MGNFFQKRFNFWFWLFIVFSAAILVYLGFFRIPKTLHQASSENPVLRVGIEENLASELVPKIKNFAKSSKSKIEFNLIPANEYPNLDLLLVSEALTGKTKLLGSISQKEIVFANKNPKSPPVYIYSLQNHNLILAKDLLGFLKKSFSDTSEITLVAGGDIMLSRHVGTKIYESGNPNLPFLKIADLFKSADLAFANLESPFYDQGPRITEGMVFKAEPETVSGLNYAGLDILSLANNHFGNQGRAGMLYTYSHLLANQIEYVGAGKNYIEAHTLKILERKNTRFGFLAYNNIPPISYQADANTPGHAWMEIKALEEDIKEAKKICDIVIVSMHSGVEYTPNPNSTQINFARAAIDAGANLVLGHHPHVVQAFETYKNGIIFYSLGNLVFDQEWSTETTQGVVAKIVFRGKKPSLFELIPIHIYNFNQPKIIENQTEKSQILERIYEANQNLPTKEVEI